MINSRLTQLIAANQIAAGVYVALAPILFGAPVESGSAAWLGIVIGVLAVTLGILAVRGSRPGTIGIAAMLALQIVQFATTKWAWQLCLGANWRLTFQPPPIASTLGFEGLFSITPWPSGGGSLLEINVTALLASGYLLIVLYRARPDAGVARAA